MANRYYYLDADGRVRGPCWLSMMRDLWRKGRLNMSTEVSLDGTDRWQPAEFHPEIFEEEVRLPAFRKLVTARSNPARLLVLMVLLLAAVLTWQVIKFFKEPERPRPGAGGR